MSDLHSHIVAVDALNPVTASKRPSRGRTWTRYGRFLALDDEHAATELLAAAVVTGEGEASLPQLYGAALAEWWPKSVSDVRGFVGARVHAELSRLYSPHADRSYKQVCDEFNAVVKQFTGCVELIDPETGSDGIIGEHEKLRNAWMDAPRHAGRLDALLSRSRRVLCWSALTLPC